MSALPDTAGAGNSAALLPYEYAGFWRRFLAMLIDWLMTSVFGALVFRQFQLESLKRAILSADVFLYPSFLHLFLMLTASWLYYALMESSRYRATIGKLVLRIKVADMDGQRATFAKTSVRFFAKLLSGFLLMAGYLMQVFTAKRQALHDKLAGCIVIRAPNPEGRLTGRDYGSAALAVLFFGWSASILQNGLMKQAIREVMSENPKALVDVLEKRVKKMYPEATDEEAEALLEEALKSMEIQAE